VTSALDKFCSGDNFVFRRDLPAFVKTSAVKAKIAPWCLARRDYFLAKVPGLVSADGATNVYSINRRAVSTNSRAIFFGLAP
jgi:hypothetical protein